MAGTMAIAYYLTSQYCGQNVTSCVTPADAAAANISVGQVVGANVSQIVPFAEVISTSGTVSAPVAITASMSTMLLNPLNSPQTTVRSQGSIDGALQLMKGVVALHSNTSIPPSYPYDLYVSGAATIDGSFNQTGKTITLGTNDSSTGKQLKINGGTTNLIVTYSLPVQAIPAIIPQGLQQYSTLTLTTDSSGAPEIVIPQSGTTLAHNFGVEQAGTYTINQDSNPGGVSIVAVEQAYGLSFTSATSKASAIWGIQNPTSSYSDSNGSVYGFIYATTDVSLKGNGYMTVVSTGSIDVQANTVIFPFAYYSSGSNAICSIDAAVCSGNPLTPLLKLQGLALVAGSDSFTGYGIIFEPGSETINGSIGSNGEIYVHGGGHTAHTINGMIVANGGLAGNGNGQSLLSQGQFTTSSLGDVTKHASFGGAVQYFSIRRMKWCSTLSCPS
jgi:hypothetical protein